MSAVALSGVRYVFVASYDIDAAVLAKALLLSTLGSYHAPSQMAMMCSGMMSDKRTD